MSTGTSLRRQHPTELDQMLSTPDSCSRCPRRDNLQRCSKCQSVWYCSLECELAGLKSHNLQCQILEGSDPLPSPAPELPTPTDDDHWLEKTIAALGVPRPPRPKTDFVLGVKIRPEGFANPTSRGLNPSFVEERFAPMDPIFVAGVLCPVTEFYGIPILILFQPRTGGLGDENFPALQLYIGGVHGGNRNCHGLSRERQRCLDAGNAFVVRRDRKPLTKETVETMYRFHLTLEPSNSLKDKKNDAFRPPFELRISPADFREFSEKYWSDEAKNLERGRYSLSARRLFIHRVFGGLLK